MTKKKTAAADEKKNSSKPEPLNPNADKVSRLRDGKKSAEATEKPAPVQPVTSDDGVVTMSPTEDSGEGTEGDAVSVKPTLDKETGVITMVPQE